MGAITRCEPRAYNIDICRKEVLNHLRNVAAARGSGTRLADERAALARAQREVAQLKAGQLKGSLVEVEEVCFHLTNRYALIKEKLLALPGRLGDVLAMRQRHDVIEILKAEIHEALNELAEPSEIVKEAGGRPDHNGQAERSARPGTSSVQPSDPVSRAATLINCWSLSRRGPLHNHTKSRRQRVGGKSYRGSSNRRAAWGLLLSAATARGSQRRHCFSRCRPLNSEVRPAEHSGRRACAPALRKVSSRPLGGPGFCCFRPGEQRLRAKDIGTRSPEKGWPSLGAGPRGGGARSLLLSPRPALTLECDDNFEST
jgi:hypothetical protein